MDIYSEMAQTIIKEQEKIIGPIALEQAQKVEGLDVGNIDNIKINGDAKAVLTNLVGQYFKLFGNASIEVCKEAVRETKPPVPEEQLPEILR